MGRKAKSDSNRDYHARNRDVLNEQARARWERKKDEYAERRRVRYQDDADRHRRRAAERRLAEPEKVRARLAVTNAVASGRLVKGECAELSAGDCLGRIEAHHVDYARPLDVEWLCARHHKRRHREERLQQAA
jgi:hypothetical protein